MKGIVKDLRSIYKNRDKDLIFTTKYKESFKLKGNSIKVGKIVHEYIIFFFCHFNNLGVWEFLNYLLKVFSSSTDTTYSE